MIEASAPNEIQPAQAETPPTAGLFAPLWWGLAFSLCMFLAFPRIGVWPLVMLAVPSLFMAGHAGWQRPRRSGLLAMIGTLPFWFFEQRWLVDVTAAGYPLLCLYLSAYPGVFVWFVARGARGIHARLDSPARANGTLSALAPRAAVLWVGLEVIRGEWGLTGYPWFLIAHPLIEWPPLAAPASYLGTYVVSYFAAVVGLSAMVLVLTRARRCRAISLRFLGVHAFVWVLLSVMGARQLDFSPANTWSVRVGLVQTNIPQTSKLRWNARQKLGDFGRFLELTQCVAAQGADVIVWPETMFPGGFLDRESVFTLKRGGMAWPGKEPGEQPIAVTLFADELLDAQIELGIPMVVGALAADNLRIVREGEGGAGTAGIAYDRRYNSAFLVYGGRVVDRRYDKMHLTPFGEIIPYLWRWPALQQLALDLGARGMRFDLAKGTSATTIEVPMGPSPATLSTQGASRPESLRLATPICFEATQPGLVRALAYPGGRRAADLLVNLSNDGWFGDYPGGREQHLQAAAWRCVELGLPMVRSVNTGISCAIDARGRVLHVIEAESGERVNAEAAGSVDVQLTRAGSTLFGRTGDFLRWIVLAVSIGILYQWLIRTPRTPQGRTT